MGVEKVTVISTWGGGRSVLQGRNPCHALLDHHARRAHHDGTTFSRAASYGVVREMAILRQPLAVSIRQRSSIFGDDEVSQLPGILISLDLDLLRLLVHLQLACRQYGARALSIGGEDPLDGADAVVPGTRTAVQLAEGKVAIGDETESAPALGGQFDDVLDVVSYTPTGESDTALGLHILEDIHKAVLAGACESID